MSRSAADRVTTLKAFADLSNKASDFSKPGHMFPLAAKPGGVLERGGHTESAYDLCRYMVSLTFTEVFFEL